MNTHSDEPGAAGTIARLLAGRAELLASVPSPDTAARHAALVDVAIAELAAGAAAAADPGKPWAVVALGGYGAGRLLPYSDIDLLVATEARAERLKPFVQTLLYPLWDAGLTVGHAVRGRRDALDAAKDDLANRTALLTARLVAGSPESFATGGAGRFSSTHAATHPRSLPELAARERPGSPFELWPDLKDGRGGQRDLDELVWTATVLAGTAGASWTALSADALIPTDEAGRLDRARDTLTMARWVAHAARGRGDNRWDEDTEAIGPDEVGRGLTAALALIDATTTGVRAALSHRGAFAGARVLARAPQAPPTLHRTSSPRSPTDQAARRHWIPPRGMACSTAPCRDSRDS